MIVEEPPVEIWHLTYHLLQITNQHKLEQSNQSNNETVKLSVFLYNIHCEAKKLHPFYFLNYFVKSRSIMIIIGTQIPE